MKHLYRALILFLLFGHVSQAQIFVKADASGANDGTSWANAYTDLSDALANAASGAQLWVAAATYRPGGATPSNASVFSIATDLSVYGGFAGTETSLSQRNPSTNVTILSGDINGDDVLNDFSTNRSDNTFHVVYVDSLISGDILMDGLHVRGGHTGTDDGQPGYFWQGGGIHCQSHITLVNSTFSGNFARTGGALYLSPKCAASLIHSCTFNNNGCTEQSAGIFADQVTQAQITLCSFSNNQTVRGALYLYYCFEVEVDSCLFLKNVNSTGAGGAFYNFSSSEILLANSQFQENVATNSGALYYDNDLLAFVNSENFIVRNCVFSKNTATSGVGGAMRNFRGSYTLENCLFEESSASGSGGQIRNDTNGDNVVYNNCTFRQGSSGGWGGAHTCYGVGSYTISNCIYEDNSTTNLGGVSNIGFGAKVHFDNCTFSTNATQNSSGGALSLQNDSTSLVVTNCTFNNNTTNFSGGAIFSGASSSSSFVVVDGCEFWANEANFGAAIHCGENGAPEATLTISNTIFGFNLAMTQGGALNISDADAAVTSCLFFNNIADNTGTGGAMSLNATDSNHVDFVLMNNTLADNFGLLSGGIANWTGTDQASSNLTLQNNIFRQDGAANYVIEDGTPTATSNGGNMSDDNSMSLFLLHAKDQNESSPDFADVADFNYQLADDSPGIDDGVDDGAPALDLLGNPRINAVDMGSYENQNVTRTQEVLLPNNGILRLTPNPATNGKVKLTLTNDWRGPVQVRIFDVQGRIVVDTELAKPSETLQHWLYPGLKTGVYQVVASNGAEAVVERLIAF